MILKSVNKRTGGADLNIAPLAGRISTHRMVHIRVETTSLAMSQKRGIANHRQTIKLIVSSVRIITSESNSILCSRPKQGDLGRSPVGLPKRREKIGLLATTQSSVCLSERSVCESIVCGLYKKFRTMKLLFLSAHTSTTTQQKHKRSQQTRNRYP